MAECPCEGSRVSLHLLGLLSRSGWWGKLGFASFLRKIIVGLA